jgi:hypothetical protein
LLPVATRCLAIVRSTGLTPGLSPSARSKEDDTRGRQHAAGVRKAAATRATDRSVSANTLMATFGWLDIRQAELYMRSAERKRLAHAGMHVLATNG